MVSVDTLWVLGTLLVVALAVVRLDRKRLAARELRRRLGTGGAR